MLHHAAGPAVPCRSLVVGPGSIVLEPMNGFERRGDSAERRSVAAGDGMAAAAASTVIIC
jgi:hypothetical protein